MKKSSRRAAPKKLQAVQASRHWQVVHHRHTGHLTHRRTTSYPTLFMIILCVGVFLAGWTGFVTADPLYPGPVTNSYSVKASVPGPPPTIAATIDSPADGAIFTTQPITVNGTCPLNTYETLYRNGAFSGVALCDANGRYELETGLFPGINQLQVRVFSPTDVPGPMSAMVSVTYQPPVAPKPPSTGGNPGSPSNNPSTTNTDGPTVRGQPLIFKTTYAYEGHYVGTASTWQLDIEGGTAPYAISVDWGDGQHSLVSRPSAGNFTLEHVYKKPGGYRGSYVTKFSASDSEGNETLLQLLAIVNNPPDNTNDPNRTLIPGLGGTGGSNGDGAGGQTFDTYILTLLKYIWPGYLIVVLMLISFWLGERREYHHLKPRLKKIRHA